MSFSSGVKGELEKHFVKARHCQLAEIAALHAFGGVANTKYFTLLRKTLNIDIALSSDETKIFNELGNKLKVFEDGTVDSVVMLQPCCKRSYIRGAFLAAGSVSDPDGSYHFEIVCRTLQQAKQLMDIMSFFELSPKIVERKGRQVVYLKEGDQIVDVLRVMEASMAVMDIENARILKEKREVVNRQVNCETANIRKTVDAASRQTDDIEYIQKTVGLSQLPENLREVAVVRLENPDLPLKDLGNMLNPPLGKSGVNHRLKRISEFADKLKEKI